MDKAKYHENHPHCLIELGNLSHQSEGQLICKLLIEKVPHFKARVFQENGSLIGIIKDIFGPINASMATVELSDSHKIESYKFGEKLFIEPSKLSPLESLFY